MAYIYRIFVAYGVYIRNVYSNLTNYVEGLYADGFFDRRVIGNDPSGSAMAVAETTNEIANGGGLFYNEATSASLFMPVLGYRDGNSGNITRNADEHYWTSTSSGNSQAWAFRGWPNKNSALAIRCVKE